MNAHVPMVKLKCSLFVRRSYCLYQLGILGAYYKYSKDPFSLHSLIISGELLLQGVTRASSLLQFLSPAVLLFLYCFICR